MSDLKLAGTYRDHAITFSAWCEEAFTCSDLNLRGKTWESLKSKIDRALKADHKRVPIILIRRECEFGEITSLCDEHDVCGYGDNKSRQAWVVTDKGRRGKEPLSICVLQTPENMAALKLAGEEQKQADSHNAKSAEIIKAIPRVQVSDVLETGKAVAE
jgi:hypothetical protein